MTPWPHDWPTPDALQRLAREIVAGDDGVEFVFGHAVIQALRSPPRHSSNLLGWFRSTMTRARIDWLRSPEFRGQDDLHEGDDGFLFDALAQESEPEEMDRAELTEMVEFLNSEVDALSPRDREIVHLDFWEGLSVIEISARLDISESTVLRTKRRVLESMRETVGDEPERNGRTLLALAGVPPRLWNRETATGTAVGIGPLSLLVAAVLALVSFLAIQGLKRGPTSTSDDTSIVRLGGAGVSDMDRTERMLPSIAVEPERAARSGVPSPEIVDEDRSAAASQVELAADEVAGEDAGAPTQNFVLIVRERGVPLIGLAGNAWTQDAAGKVVSVDPVAPTPEDAASGVYRFELPVLPVAWKIGVEDKSRRTWVVLRRQLADETVTEVIDVDLVGRSFSYPKGKDETFPNIHESPWQMLVGVTTLRPATWVLSFPRPHGGRYLNGAYERRYDGQIHLDAASVSGMKMCYTEVVEGDPSSYVPVTGIVEIPFVPRAVRSEAAPGELPAMPSDSAPRVPESVEEGR